MDYRKEMLYTASVSLEKESFEKQLSLGALGLGGESGEVVDLIKKVLHHGKPLDKDKLIEEMGDVRWYLEYLAASIGVSMEEIETRNIKKLRARYPNGFSKEAANAPRKDLTFSEEAAIIKNKELEKKAQND